MTSREDVTAAVNFTVFEFEDTKKARSRYIWIGVFGIVLNGTAVLYLSLDRRARLTLRVTMIGLALNDLGFNASLVLLGNPRWTLVSETINCWVTTYIMVTSVIVSYFIAIQLSLHNYLAVFYPFHCNVILTVFRCTSALIASCFTGYLLSLACLGLTFEPGLPCYVLVIVPRSGMATACGICLTSSLVIITLNAKVCMRIRRRNREINFQGSARLPHVFSVDSAIRPQVVTGNSRCQDISKERVTGTTREYRDIKYNDPIPSTSNIKTDTMVLTMSRNRDLGVGSSAVSTSFLKQINPKLIASKIKHQNVLLEQSNQTNVDVERCIDSKAGIDTVKCKEQTAGHFSENPAKSMHNKPGMVAQTISKCPLSGRRSRSGTSKTLAIMTWCSCFLAFPLLIEMIYGTIWVNDRVQFVKNWFGILVSSLLTAHGVSNPLLYGWRLIAWRELYKKVQKCSCRCKQQRRL
ncbi:hypothetical protein BgiMline_006735 [Biomphalaria glabrata]|nr:hypothetical protein BgiMline_004607 [Biomphalaria glabrata]KAI8794871.1 hypothetical protein BgiBS90_005247 [Biomphalaria glabrata]